MQDLVGLALLVVAIVGEAIADRQLRLFKSNPSNRGAVCDVGLWSWSRHPNYFFEWLSWLAYPIVAIDFAGHNPYGWLALAAPVSMYWVLVHVSGIPPLEKHMLNLAAMRSGHIKHGPVSFSHFPRRIDIFWQCSISRRLPPVC